MDDEDAIAWQDVLDEIAAGRPGNAACPFCGTAPMKVESMGGEPMQGGVPVGRTRIICTKCGKFIEGTFGGY
ncbi:MAG: hypothetical protein MJE77_39120 [Proteobacteria bacterium]|nr:hypothetical protein [Pseudomonadota bacterium]